LIGGDVVRSGVGEIGVDGLFCSNGLRLEEIFYFIFNNSSVLGCIEVVGFYNLLWATIGRFVMVDNGGVGVMVVMALDLFRNHSGG
jgi:hypothetical protein